MSAAVYQYWRERLEDVCPFNNRNYLNDPAATYYDSLQRPTWPTAISTSAFYNDFAAWFRSRYIEPLESSPEYEANANYLPSQPHPRTFFIQLRDFIFIYPHNKPKVRRVRKARLYEGSTFYESKLQRFIFLNDWKVHTNAFEQLTMTTITPKVKADMLDLKAS